MRVKFNIFVFLIIIGFSQNIFADYPVMSHRFLADPGSLVYNGRVYLYCSNDNENPTGNDANYEMKSIVCVSSSDMKNWTDHGIVFQVPRDASWAGKSWAPSAIERDGKFFLYFGNGGNGIGVASSDSPLGPFTDPIDGMLINTETPGVLPAENMWLFDPMAFIDDDGQAYLYFGGNGDNNVRAIKLNKDMISVDSAAIQLYAQDFFEASWMHKHNGKYYFSYSSNPSAGMRIDYMISDSPISGFTYGGIVSPQPPTNNNNNHQAIFNFNGTWYQAYHNRYVANQAGVPATYKRNLCIDTFSHNDDGTINIMENTLDGLSQVGYINPYERIEAETMNTQSGIETEVSSAGGMSVSSIENGDWIKVRGVDFGTVGAGTFTASVSCESKLAPSVGGNIELHIDNIDGTLIGTIPVNYTGGTDIWQNETVAISHVTGVHNLYLIFTGEATNNDLFKFDYWQFTEQNNTPELTAVNASINAFKIDTLSGHNNANIAVTAVYSNGTSEDITSTATFTFNHDNIVSISNGVVKGENYGNVTITAAYNGKTDSVKLIVKNLESELSVKELSSNINNVELFSGTSISLEITAKYIDEHTEIVTNKATYETSNSEVATVNQGIILAKGMGEASITAKYKGEKGDEQSTVINVKVSNRSPFIKNEAEDFDEQTGTQLEDCSDENGGFDVGYIEDGDWLKYTNLDFGNGASSFEARAASSTEGGNIELRLGSTSGELIGTCTVTGTGGWQEWTTFSCDVSPVSGFHDLYLVFTNGSSFLMNLNWWQFGEFTSIKNTPANQKLFKVLSTGYSKILTGTQLGDVVTLYNPLGQKLDHFSANSNQELLKNFKGLVLIQVKRGNKNYFLKALL